MNIKGTFLLFLIFILHNYGTSQSLDTCVVVNKTTVFEKPNLKSERLTFFERDDSVAVIDKVKTFYKIKADDLEGFIQFTDLRCTEIRPVEKKYESEKFDPIKNIPQGTRGIIVEFNYDSIDIFHTVIRQLVKFGYGIDKYDKEMGFIQTIPCSSKETFGEVIFFILVNENGFQIKGDYREFVSLDHVNPWEEIRKEGVELSLVSSMRGSFTEMFEFANSFDSINLSYWKKE